MKKIIFNEKQKKITKRVMAGSAVTLGAIGVLELISRSEVGGAIKNACIDHLLNSKGGKNGENLAMHTFISKRISTDSELNARAFQEAWKVFNDILEAGKPTK